MHTYKKFAAVLMVIAMIMMLTGGNNDDLDFTYIFDRAIIKLPNGKVIEGKVSSWKDYDDGDQILVKIDGKAYLVHSSNIFLISE